MTKIEKLKLAYAPHIWEKINEIIDHLNRANGGSPEVDNTVGQKLIEDYIVYALRNHTKEAWSKDSTGEAKLLGYIMYIFNQFKPRETDKKEPIVIEMDKEEFSLIRDIIKKDISPYHRIEISNSRYEKLRTQFNIKGL